MAFSKTKLYWFLQLFGWLGYAILIGYSNFSAYGSFSAQFILSLVSIYIICLFFSHFYRQLIVKLNLLSFNLTKLLLPIFLGALALSIATYFFKILLVDVVIEQKKIFFLWAEFFFSIAGWFVIYLLWSLFYYLFHYVTNYKNEEIKNLKWEAKKNEIELNRLISQLNPHFIFNAMNSIRALIDENPKLAKTAINQLSNVLRSSLLMGKNTLISFSEELKLVEDYLSLEKTRFEEKLIIKKSIDTTSNNFQFPPLLLQTLIENGIKHGTSKLPKGGTIELFVNITPLNQLEIIIYNSGFYDEKTISATGFGLANTKQRLEILYGEKAFFAIENDVNSEEKRVKTTLRIPC